MFTYLKKVLTKFLILSILGVGVVNTTSTVYAADYYTYNDHHMTGYGVGNYGKNTQKYYIVDTAHNHKGVVNSAMSEWINTTSRLNYTTPISFKQTTTRADSVIDFMNTKTLKDHSGFMHSESVLAWTEFYKTGGKQIDASTKNWKYCYVKFYCTNFDKKSTTNRKGTAAHEIGHCFGLRHNNKKTSSIMCQTAYGRKVSSAQICDLKGINHLYK